MEFLKKPKWKRILLAVVCFLALAVLASGSYAAYNSQAFQRGVVRNGNGETIRFTSNYLQTCASGSTDYAGQTILYDKSLKKDDPISFDIYIYIITQMETPACQATEILLILCSLILRMEMEIIIK